VFIDSSTDYGKTYTKAIKIILLIKKSRLAEISGYRHQSISRIHVLYYADEKQNQPHSSAIPIITEQTFSKPVLISDMHTEQALYGSMLVDKIIKSILFWHTPATNSMSSKVTILEQGTVVYTIQ